MTTYKTGNPIGSVSPKDLFDNSENLDRAINGTALTWGDRFGKNKLSWAGIQDRARIDTEAAATAAAAIATVQAGEYRDEAQQARDDAVAAAAASGEFVFAETYAQAVGKLPLPEGTVVEVGSDETHDYSRTRYLVDAGELKFAVNLDLLRTALAQPKGASLVGFRQVGSGAIGLTVEEKLGQRVSVADFGALGSGELESAAIQKAVDSGAKTLEFPFGDTGTYKFEGVDFKGVHLVSNEGAALDGAPVNAGRIEGLSIAGSNVSGKAEGVLPQMQFSGGFVVKYRTIDVEGDDAYYVITKSSAREEYAAIRIRASPAADTGPWELQRSQGVFSLWDAFAYQSVLPGGAVNAEYVGSGWGNFTISPSVLGYETGTTSGSENTAVVCRRTGVRDDKVTVLARPDRNGDIKLSFLKSSNMSREVLLEYAGKVETFSLVEPGASGPSIYTVTLNVRSPGAVPITITQKDSGRSLTFVAVQADRPEQVRPEVSYDAWCYYVMPTYRSPEVNPGAAEYAFRDNDAVLPSFVGSYHGREVALDPHKWILDGMLTSLVRNIPAVAKRGILLKQHTEISGKLKTWSEYSFGDGSRSFSCAIEGQMRANTVYLGMVLPQLHNATFDKPCFTEILYPRRIDVSAPGRYALGNTELVIWRNPQTEARVMTWVRSFTGYASMNGGASIESAIGSTSVAKLRTGMQQDAENMFRGASFQIITVFA